MEDLRLLFVLIVVMGYLLGTYVSRSLRRAQEQKRIAAKLETDLMDCNYTLFEEPFSEYLFIGHILEEKYVLDAVVEKGSQGIAEAKKDFMEKLHELKADIEADKKEVHKSVAKQYNHYRSMSPDQFAKIIQQIKEERDKVKENVSFISYQEASMLSLQAAHCAVQMKDHLYTIIDKTHEIALALRRMESLNLKNISNELYEIVENIVLFSRKYFPMLGYAQNTQEQYLLVAAVRNMLLINV